MMTLLSPQSEKSEAALQACAYASKSLPILVDDSFLSGMTDADFMRVAVLLARKSYNEGGCQTRHDFFVGG